VPTVLCQLLISGHLPCVELRREERLHPFRCCSTRPPRSVTVSQSGTPAQIEDSGSQIKDSGSQIKDSGSQIKEPLLPLSTGGAGGARPALGFLDLGIDAP
jgi:hypothetical protein